MNELFVALLLLVNLIVFMREFFAVWDYIDSVKLRGRFPESSDYFELLLNGTLISCNFLLLCSLCFRR